MPKLTHEVQFEEWLVACETWDKLMNANRLPRKARHAYAVVFERATKEYHYFENFLGRYDYVVEDPFVRVRTTEAAYNKIKLLSSPHARTLLKAFKARTGYHKEIP